ncbi:MAG: hypothetical protein UV73_C0004G0044 [Candidatus Gottesmanbacteria bacterium GW2011_GWA2_43_14]|uniref:Uncharacterized protein n=1 Tax=Candidatus Gottesmanbacteria bacterium GW2011_GWA2_43_14 TaxID=1618443 RepID=A0A0G1DJZ3_9BACT|nr:MAG: hypothetical protein UV73_C0004G0044 [Candidatus Gottesmanbacteria bacterium GW2011_GWA2_43_14]
MLKVANFPGEQIKQLMENIDYVSEGDKLELSQKAWSFITEKYHAQLALEKIHILDEVKAGKRKYNANDIEEVKTRLIHELMQKLSETESKESLDEVRKSLEVYSVKKNKS